MAEEKVLEGSELPIVDTSAIDLEVVPKFAIDIREAHERLLALKRFVAGELQKGIDHGTLPGTTKPSLWQPGAQKLNNIFGFYGVFTLTKESEDWEDGVFVYRHKCEIFSKRGNTKQAECEATCSSMESKYRYRWINASPDEKKRADQLKEEEGYKWRKVKGKPVFQKRILNPDRRDLSNTIIRMSQKRAYVGATISATRAADIFSYDLEALEQEEQTAEGPEIRGKPTKEEVEEEINTLFGTAELELASQQEIQDVLDIASSNYITPGERQKMKTRLTSGGVTKAIVEGFNRKLKGLIAERNEIERKGVAGEI